MERGKIIYPEKLKKIKVVFYSVVLSGMLLISSKTFAQISPGDLTTAHAKLEGISNCTKCHELGKKVVNEKCLDCHKEIKNRIDKGEGYHASKDVKGKECASCHSEHNGRNFQIVRFDKDNFNHSKTTFTLTGKHKELDCKKCHRPKFIQNDKLKKRDSTYLGLSKDCKSCHEDFHQKTLGVHCGTCHDTETFKKAVLFHHDETNFRLTGAHNSVVCIKCHAKTIRNGKNFQEFKLVSFNGCESCHKDVHRGKFGKNCQKCHNTSSFKNFKSSNFNHSRTNFPLLGKHRNVKCADCHGAKLTSHPAYKLCTDCHKDYHKGQFATTKKTVEDCKDCHTVAGFSPSVFTIEQHQKTKFKLNGSHLAVSCKSCHLKKKTWKFRDLGTRCIDCHKNVHGKELTAKFLGNNNCESCHSTASWAKITFDHSKTSFQLLGKHKVTNCGGCHTTKSVNGKIKYRFVALQKANCETCHKDIHYGQFTLDYDNDCTRCHNFESWKPVKFNHEKTEFSLKGAHSKLSCYQCHKQETVGSVKFVKFKLENFKCATCHSS